MIVLSDNDLILKLAQCDLLDHLEELLRSGPDQILITATARYQLLKKTPEKGIASCGNEATYDRLKAFFDRTAVLPAIQDLELLAKLATVSGIDSGEQQLFAAMLELDAPLLLTDDKRSLESLRNNANYLDNVLSAVSGQVVTFATVLLLAVECLGFPIVKQKLLGNPKPDGMLRLVLREDMTQDNFIDCLSSHAKPLAEFLAFAERLPDVFG